MGRGGGGGGGGGRKGGGGGASGIGGVNPAGLSGDLHQQAMEAAKMVPASQRYGDNKVWIDDAHAAYAAAGGKLSLGEFKAGLASSAEGRMIMSRADLVQAMSRSKVESSDTHVMSGGRAIATFNFIKLR